MRNRSLLIGLAGTTVGGGVAGFSAALLFGVQAGFSQPLATFLAGAGALTAGVLAYINGERSRDLSKQQHEFDTKRERERHEADMNRERERHAEDSRRAQVSILRDRYTAIAAQIADQSAAIRQAGVYALTALADDWHAFGEDDERQVCINLLQWYLRVPFPEGKGPGKPNPAEREIRQTIVAILTARHRHPADHPKSWASSVISFQQMSLMECAFPRNDFADFNMSGVDLNGATLTFTSLANTTLDRAKLFRADLSGADLSGATLASANLAEAKLTGSALIRANLCRANLTRANLNSADLTEARLFQAKLVGAHLTGATLSGATLSGANLTGANLTRAALTGADLIGTTFDESTQWPDGFTPPST